MIITYPSGGQILTPDPPTPAELAQMEIDRIERETLTPRWVRESLIYVAEKEATELGIPLAVLAAKNKGYATAKAVDAQIEALRQIIRENA